MGNAQGGDKEGKCGYRVLGVQPNSPASKVGLVSFFDFIVAADGEFRVLEQNVGLFCGQHTHTQALRYPNSPSYLSYIMSVN